MRIEEIVKAAIPNAKEGMIDFILWSRTPYPFTQITAKSLYKAASRFARANKHDIRLCDFCDRIAENNHGTCKNCHAALHINK